jgi:hypothetical protein
MLVGWQRQWIVSLETKCNLKKEGVKLNKHPDKLTDLHRIQISKVLKQNHNLWSFLLSLHTKLRQSDI